MQQSTQVYIIYFDALLHIHKKYIMLSLKLNKPTNSALRTPWSLLLRLTILTKSLPRLYELILLCLIPLYSINNTRYTNINSIRIFTTRLVDLIINKQSISIICYLLIKNRHTAHHFAAT